MSIIKVQGSFIDLLNELEKINVEFIDLTGLYGYKFINLDHNIEYQITTIINNYETYTFVNIPNAIFRPDNVYDFEVNINDKKLKVLNKYSIITILEIEEEKNSIKPSSKWTILDCFKKN